MYIPEVLFSTARRLPVMEARQTAMKPYTEPHYRRLSASAGRADSCDKVREYAARLAALSAGGGRDHESGKPLHSLLQTGILQSVTASITVCIHGHGLNQRHDRHRYVFLSNVFLLVDMSQTS